MHFTHARIASRDGSTGKYDAFVAYTSYSLIEISKFKQMLW